MLRLLGVAALCKCQQVGYHHDADSLFVKGFGDVLGDVFALGCFCVILLIEQLEVELVGAFALPQSQCADGAVAVTDDRHVVGTGADLAVLHRNDDAEIVAADTPRVAKLCPAVG